MDTKGLDFQACVGSDLWQTRVGMWELCKKVYLLANLKWLSTTCHSM